MRLNKTDNINFKTNFTPGSAVVVQYATGASVIARITEAGVNLALALVAVVARGALARVALEAAQVTGPAVLTGVGETHVALGQNLWVGLVCNTKGTR